MGYGQSWELLSDVEIEKIRGVGEETVSGTGYTPFFKGDLRLVIIVSGIDRFLRKHAERILAKCSTTIVILCLGNWQLILTCVLKVYGKISTKINFTGETWAIYFNYLYLLLIREVWADNSVFTETHLQLLPITLTHFLNH